MSTPRTNLSPSIKTLVLVNFLLTFIDSKALLKKIGFASFPNNIDQQPSLEISKISEIENSFTTLKEHTTTKINQIQDTLDTFNLAETHIKTLTDMSKFKKTLESKVNAFPQLKAKLFQIIRIKKFLSQFLHLYKNINDYR